MIGDGEAVVGAAARLCRRPGRSAAGHRHVRPPRANARTGAWRRRAGTARDRAASSSGWRAAKGASCSTIWRIASTGSGARSGRKSGFHRPGASEFGMHQADHAVAARASRICAGSARAAAWRCRRRSAQSGKPMITVRKCCHARPCTESPPARAKLFANQGEGGLLVVRAGIADREAGRIEPGRLPGEGADCAGAAEIGMAAHQIILDPAEQRRQRRLCRAGARLRFGEASVARRLGSRPRDGARLSLIDARAIARSGLGKG